MTWEELGGEMKRPEDQPPHEDNRETEVSAPAAPGFERWDVSMPVPVPQASRPERSSSITAAAAILVVIGVFVAAVAVVFLPGGDIELATNTVSDTLAMTAFLVMSTAYIAAGVLVYRRHQAGRALGIAIGALGVLFGIVQLPSSGAAGLPTLAVNGFIIWALASSGASFRRG
jgi:hypothetical protein